MFAFVSFVFVISVAAFPWVSFVVLATLSHQVVIEMLLVKFFVLTCFFKAICPYPPFLPSAWSYRVVLPLVRRLDISYD